MNTNNRGKVGEKGSISSLSHSQFSFTTANMFCPQKLSCVESIKFQLLASVFTGSCHLLLLFNDPDTAKPCLLQSAVPTAERMQQCCLQKNRCCSFIIVQCPLLSTIAFFFSFLSTVILKSVTIPCVIIKSWIDYARLEGKTQPPSSSNNYNIVLIFLETRSEELWKLSVFSMQ